MKRIELTQGKVALVDDEDYELINQYKWHAHFKCGKWVARRRVIIEGKRRVISMHRFVLGLNYKDKRQVDHINHNTLDNRRKKIRICSNTQNAWNRRIANISKTSQYKGVYWDKQKGKWRAQIKVAGIKKHLGYYWYELFAAMAYDRRALGEYGEYAWVNFHATS